MKRKKQVVEFVGYDLIYVKRLHINTSECSMCRDFLEEYAVIAISSESSIGNLG